jgi:hypothetical protein
MSEKPKSLTIAKKDLLKLALGTQRRLIGRTRQLRQEWHLRQQ